MPIDRGIETLPSSPADEHAAEVPGRLDHFTIERPLGAGGMGMVFAARDVTLGRSVALKLVHPQADEPRHHERLLREAQALAKLSHPNVVTVHEVGEVDGKVFIAMELLEGSTLRDWMRVPHPWRRVAAHFLAAGRGLAAVHAIGLVHRDFKPSNVFLDGRGAVKVGDFGLVVAAEVVPRDDAVTSRPASGSLTSTGATPGTPAYMAPEQVVASRVDARADQFSFCVSLKEALTGVAPGDRLDGARCRPVPRRLRGLVERGLAEEPSQRYPSMDALLAELERALRPAAGTRLAVAAAAVAVAALTVALVVKRGPSMITAPPATKVESLDPAIRAKADRIASELARLHLLAEEQLSAGDSLAAAATLREITQLAAAAHEDEQAARAWVKLVVTVAGELRKPDEALGFLAAAEAAVVRAGSPFDLRLELVSFTAELYSVTNRRTEALAKLAEARQLVDESGRDLHGSSIPGDLATSSGAVYSNAGDYDRAVVAYRDAVATYRRSLGPDQPQEANAWHKLADLMVSQGHPREGADAYREAIRIRHARPGDPSRLVVSLVGLATALQAAHDWDPAFAALDEAVRLSREKMAADDPQRVTAVIALATARAHREQMRDAAALLDEVIAFFERTGAKTIDFPISLYNRGDVELRQRRFGAALPWLDRSIASFVALDGPRSRHLVAPLAAEGRALVELRRPGEALAPLERALALTVPARGEGSAEQATARFYRGRAMVESGVDRQAGLAEARAGRETMAATGADTKAADAWLAKRR
jgi:tRNA A-37 threonylcarbamoyl transferase component Bud32/tetratricopeptide (TPR) repeat protein